MLAFAAPALAHPAPYSYVDVRVGAGAIDVTVAAHVIDLAHDLGVGVERLAEPAGLAAHADAIRALLERRLLLSADGVTLAADAWAPATALPSRDAVQLRARFPLARMPGVLSISVPLFPYDPIHQTFLNVYEADVLVRQAIVRRDTPPVDHFTGTRQGTWAAVRRFAAAGVHHILIGPDHLLFLVGLLLPGGSIRRLVLVVSAFTLAHSITLSLAALGVVSPPATIVEPAIALSIVYVGADNLTVRGGRDVRAWIALAFGLVHGLGFASVLREMDLPPRALGWSLFAFNIGVEAGQLLFVVPVAALLAAVRARSEVAGRRVAFAGSIAVIAAGAFWFVERVFFSTPGT